VITLRRWFTPWMARATLPGVNRLATDQAAHATTGRLRLAVLAAALLAAALKVYVAARTLGTDDVYLFQIFAKQVRAYGPIGIYGAPSETLAPYNHPPLIGWMLQLFNVLVDHGARFATLIRLPAILADIMTTLLLFELIRTRRPVREAALGAALFAWSPALGIISGYHGNVDPVCIMFALLALYLLVVRQAPALAGISIAVGLGVKLVPIVVVPLLGYLAWRAGVRRLVMFLVGAGIVSALIWLPPLLTHFATVRHNVIGYAGYGPRQWGPAQFGVWLGIPQQWIELYAGPGRFLVLLLSAGLPVLLAWRRPSMTVPAAGLAFALFLLFTPAHAMQYTIWPIAGMYLMNIWAATAYSLAGGLLLTKVYDRWSHAYPWHWHQAWSTGMNPEERRYAALVWLVLLIATIVSLHPRLHRPATVGQLTSSDGNTQVDRRVPQAHRPDVAAMRPSEPNVKASSPTGVAAAESEPG
jgi:Dolichyl-phosphate-mannose-protein mannosyltransferase